MTGLALSQNATGLMTISGKIWICGQFTHEGEELCAHNTPFQFNLLARAKQIAMGSNHLIVLSDTNKVNNIFLITLTVKRFMCSEVTPKGS